MTYGGAWALTLTLVSGILSLRHCSSTIGCGLLLDRMLSAEVEIEDYKIMSLTRDQQRIIKMDTEIMELRMLYEREIQHEIMTEKHTLLLSRGIKNRIDKLVRARSVLNNAAKERTSKGASFAIEMAQRREAVENAKKDYDYTVNSLAAKIDELKQLVALKIEPSEELNYQVKYLTREIPKSATVLRNKERALQNWVINGEVHALRNSKDKLPKNYSPVEDADRIYGQLPDNIVTRTVLGVLDGTYEAPEKDLYKLNTKVDISMFTRPEELAVLEQNKAVEKFIPDPDVEAEEIRQLEEMHETKYQPPMID